MATITKFEELEIWKISRSLYNKVSSITERFERNSRLEFLNSLSISKGELGELKSQLFRCLDNKYISQEEFAELYLETDLASRKIASFIIYPNSSKLKGLKFKDRLQ